MDFSFEIKSPETKNSRYSFIKDPLLSKPSSIANFLDEKILIPAPKFMKKRPLPVITNKHKHKELEISEKNLFRKKSVWDLNENSPKHMNIKD